jgi:predicted ribosomally synthesized peptide with SipW-like signal peptide
MAIASAGLVVGVGAAMTLATWTDTEWDYAGAGNGLPGLGTSTFVVQQDATNPYTGAAFGNFHTNPGNALDFETGALVLSPGDSVTAPVAYETTSDSVAGTLQLQAAVKASTIPSNDTGDALWNALVLQVGWMSVAPGGTVPACTASLTGFAPIAMTGTGLSAVPAATTQTLQAATGNVLHYCFVVTLPAGSPDSLQGRTVAPAWQFSAVSS